MIIHLKISDSIYSIMEIYTTTPILDKQVLSEKINLRGFSTLARRAGPAIRGAGKVFAQGANELMVQKIRSIDLPPGSVGRGFTQAGRTGQGIDPNRRREFLKSYVNLAGNRKSLGTRAGAAANILFKQAPGLVADYAKKNPEAAAKGAMAIGRGIWRAVGGTNPGEPVSSRFQSGSYGDATPYLPEPKQDKMSRELAQERQQQAYRTAEEEARSLAARLGIPLKDAMYMLSRV